MTYNSKLAIHNSSESGTTLIEVLLYSLFVSFILVSAVLATYQILSGSNNLSNKTLDEQEAAFLMSKINWALNDVSSVNQPLPNSSGITLSIDKNGYGANSIIFSQSGDDITIKKGSSTAVSLNADRVVISRLSFDFSRKGTDVDTIKTSFYVNGKYFESIKNIR